MKKYISLFIHFVLIALSASMMINNRALLLEGAQGQVVIVFEGHKDQDLKHIKALIGDQEAFKGKTLTYGMTSSDIEVRIEDTSANLLEVLKADAGIPIKSYTIIEGVSGVVFIYMGLAMVFVFSVLRVLRRILKLRAQKT